MFTLDEEEDSLLLERIHDGQLHAKSLLIKRYRPYILRLVKQMAGPEEVEDLTQEIMMKMLMHIRKFEQRSSLKTWLYRITLNHVIQKRTRRNNSLSGLNRHRHLPDEHSGESQFELERNVLMGLALGMDESQRIPIVLTDIFRLSAKQASQHLNISEVSYRKRLSRSRAELKKWMRRNHLKPNTAVHDPEKIAKATLLINACEGSLIDQDHEATLPSFP